jgi:hypothetical protein
MRAESIVQRAIQVSRAPPPVFLQYVCRDIFDFTLAIHSPVLLSIDDPDQTQTRRGGLHPDPGTRKVHRNDGANNGWLSYAVLPGSVDRIRQFRPSAPSADGFEHLLHQLLRTRGVAGAAGRSQGEQGTDQGAGQTHLLNHRRSIPLFGRCGTDTFEAHSQEFCVW